MDHEKALETTVWLTLGDVERDLGKKPEAISAYKRCLDQGPTAEQRTAVDASLRALGAR